MLKYIRRLLLIFLCLYMAEAACIPEVFAEAEDSNIVRVGYYRGDTSFQDGFSDDDRKSGYAYEYYQMISTLTGWKYEYVYGSRTEILEKLLSGEVDIVAGIYKTDKRTSQMLFSDYDMDLQNSERYFAVNVDRPDLLKDLNTAQYNLSVYQPDFTMLLWQKYYEQTESGYILTDTEKSWLSETGSLRIGYVRDNLPLSDQAEDGSPAGVAGDLMSVISDYLNVTVEPVCYDNISLMEEGLGNDEIDAAFPVYSDLWITETKGFYQTDSFVNDRVMVVYNGSYRNDLMDKVALSETGVGQRYYLSVYYPDSEIVFFDSREDAFDSLKSGEANCMIGCSSILQRFLTAHSEYSDYNIAYLDNTEDFGFAVNGDSNLLVSILNKTISQIDNADITNAMVKYSNVDTPYTFMDFIRRYAVVVIAVIGTFFAILLWLFISFRRKTNEYNKEQVRVRAALEDALNAAKAASSAKTTFLSSMSHDIRTPMNGIIGMTAIAEANIDNPLRVGDCLKKIKASGGHLLALINEVLDMSKIESGDLHLNEESFYLSELIDNLITLNKPQADVRNHTLVVHTLNISHEEVIGDDLRLQQVFTNLVSNAIKYTPDGGLIEITLSEKPSGSAKLGCFEFAVKDNGVGMSEDYLPHVFEAFTRADDEMTAHVQGTGLGMAITHNIVRMMDGDIKVESTLGEGSEFTVTLYLKLPEKEAVLYEEFAGLEVLVADDDNVVCESMCLLLKELGVKCEWVLSGKEAVERVEARHEIGEDYFAVFLDWKMPEMDGCDAAVKIRELTGSGMPIIIISAYDWSAIEERARDAGANGFIEKPLFKSRLVHVFNHLLGNDTVKEEQGLKELTENTDFSGKRVLLAEDNEINAEIAIEVLGMTGLEVEWADNGKVAVDMMEASETGYYDCIFMDVQMPIMNGIEAVKVIRSLPRSDADTIPVFAMTANAFADDVQAVLNAGMNEHIAKPLDFNILLNVLNQYLR